jgi:hypothetical protein
MRVIAAKVIRVLPAGIAGQDEEDRGGSDETWCHQLVWDLAKTKAKRSKGKSRALALQLQVSTVPTGSWFQVQGWQTSGSCECGALGSVARKTPRTACPPEPWEGREGIEFD